MTLPSPEKPAASRYVVGFDLGTTNSAVCYVDTKETPWQIRTFAVPQLVAPGQIESRETLPSFHYQPADKEFAADALTLPWEAKRGQGSGDGGQGKKQEEPYAVGFFARDHGTLVPSRLINSAKSWLCHSGVDRLAPLLPWHGAEDLEKISPVETSSRYLAHVRDAWNARFPQEPLEKQDFVLTLPASFDEVARELTVKAALAAGLPRVVLIEEPQAAFYSWIYTHRDNWDQLVSPGQKILVCDIGGGTSDFTLIRVRRGEGGKVQFHRVAVGDHLILGGDNLDLTLAQYLEQKITSDATGNLPVPSPTPDPRPLTPALSPRQWSVLVRLCRGVKETFLGVDPPEKMTVNLPGGGSRLIGGGIHVEVTRDEVQKLLVDGFFPQVELSAKPAAHRSGFQEFGLPFAADPAITRYLASFLSVHRHVALEDNEPSPDYDTARPDIVLFNGGVFESPVLRQRLVEVIESWFQNSPLAPPPLPLNWHPVLLDNDRLDLAVARGAAYYGMVRRGEGVRIAAGLARTYYIGVENDSPLEAGSAREEASAEPRRVEKHSVAVCIVPAKAEPGQEIEVPRTLQLLISEPVEFPLFISSTRLTDFPGELIAFDRERMTPLPPIRTVLKTPKKGEPIAVPVRLHAKLTEIGTLDLWCGEIDGRRSWRLQFDVRSATQTDVAAHQSDAEREGFIDESLWLPCREGIEGVFSPEAKEKPQELMKILAAATEMSRNEWPSSLCRRLWEVLMEFEPGRRKSPTHEARWLNLLGFCLRPGYGLAVDDWRVAQTWTALQGKFAFPASRAEGWILWRRIGGGLAAGQQQALAEPILGAVRALHKQLTSGKGRGGDLRFASHDSAEMWRLLGSLEFLPVELKIDLGTMLIELLGKKKMEPVRRAVVWAIGRIGSRTPLYGPLNAVIPPEIIVKWLPFLYKLDIDTPEAALAVMQLARRTDDRYRDLSDKLRREAEDFLFAVKAPSHFVELLRRAGRLENEEQDLVFGESLPKGLKLI